jgi:hypothetical protein
MRSGANLAPVHIAAQETRTLPTDSVFIFAAASRAIARLRLWAQFELRYLRRRLAPGRFRTIVFYPEMPWARAAVYKMCRIRGHAMTRRLDRPADAIVNWEDVTHRRSYPELEAIAARSAVINLRCVDISKTRVDEVQLQTFGYCARIDPLTHHGRCVKKSDTNALHDGTVIECPVAAIETGCVYQRVIDNTVDNGLVCDIRAPVFRDTIPFCYLKVRPIMQRFSNENTSAELHETGTVLTTAEVERLLRFCAFIGLDYGELDVLRDKVDGRIYVLDVNSTPDGPPNHLSGPQSEVALARLAAAFEDAFLSRAT